MPNTQPPLRTKSAPFLFFPSAQALRDFVLIMLAWSMLTPTLALAGSVGAKNASLRRPANPGARAHAPTQAGPPSNSAASSKSEKGDALGGSGKDFWLLAPPPARGGGATSVLLAGDSDAEGIISAPASGFENRFDVKPGKSTSIEVPASAAGGDETKGTKGSGAVALHVEATGFVSASVLSRGGEGARAYVGLPSETLGTEYIAAGGGREAGGRSRLYVLAVSDSTTVTINPTVAAEGHAPGESYSVKLDEGAAYELAEDLSAGGDLTGTVVSSDKPVAAFVGYEDASAAPGGARGAGWFAQLTPTDTWGRSFVASPSGEYGGRLRVVASTDDTHVRVDGAEVATINRGRSYEQAVGSHALVSTDKPALVALRSNEFDPSGQTTAAPLVLVTPAERYAKTYTFATPADGFDRHHLNVIISGGASMGLTLDGSPVSPSSYASIGEGRFSVATLDVRGGAHHIASATPFGLAAYGEGVSSRYAYSFGASPNAPASKGKDALATNSLNATSATTAFASDCGDLVAIVRHAPGVNGRVEGSLQMLTGEWLNLNSGNVITSDLLVPGTPSIQINGTPNYQGTIDGTGSATPTGYGVTINSGAQVRHVIRRTNPVALASVPVPPSSTGTRSVTINSPGQSAGAWSTVRDLTLNSGVGAVTVPAGTYNNFTANDGSYLVFGVAGATTPAVYNFDTLTLNSNSALRLVGPVRVNVASRVNISSGAVMGHDQNPRWMELNVARFDVTVNSLASLYGVVRAPSGTVNVNGRLRGSVESDRLSVNGGASLEWMGCAAPANQAPTVSAGSNQTITLPNGVSLQGSASDDGLPSGGSLTVTWSKVSGPGTINFANDNAAATTASFTTAGTYVLRLTASDTQLTSTSDVTVTVNPENHAPTVNAGADLTVAMPNAATLSGTVTDDGLPSGSSLTSTWSVVNGPGAVTFANSHAASTTATFAASGTYVLRLTASDTQLSASDDVAVTVDPRNVAPTVNAGADQSIELPNTASINGGVNDDGYPRGSTLTYSWGAVSGPAAVSFANADALATTVSFGAPGTYTLRLTASDTEFTVADDVVVIVYPQNQPPTANAGQDKTVSIATGATLDGVVTDDGYPHGSTLTSAWVKVSGPGDVTFANAAQASTSASFGAPGVYTLRLTASDTRLTAGDDVVVTVIPVNHPPAVSAGPDVSASLGANLLRNAGAEAALVDGKIPSWTSGDGVAWAQGTPGGFGLPFGVEGATYFYPNPLLDSELRQDVDVSGFALLVDAGVQAFEFKGYVRSGTDLPADGSRVIVEYRDSSGVVLSSFDSGVVASADAWAEVSDARIVPASTRVVRVRLLSVKANAQAGGGLFDNLSLRPTGAAVASLDGSASDDGQPMGSTLGVVWSKVSGPGEVRFNNPSSAATVATFNAPGAYVLRLTASDSVFSTTDDVNVNVATSNFPPVVNAGADASVAVTQPLSLNGTANDDALPTGSTLTYAWSKASGPGSAAFANNASATTTVTFDAPGAYVLRLAVSDSEYVIADELAVTVEPANVAPTVNAGADQTISLPNSAALAGGVSDDGLPHGTALTVEWSKASGPSEVTFADAHSASTSASFGASGIYVLKLSASDTELTGEDELTVSVVGVNQPPTVSAGTPQSITLPTNGVSLNGSITDDGLPAGSHLNARWSVVGARPAVAPDYFGDDFEDAVFDTSKWTIVESGNMQLAEQNGRLEYLPNTQLGAVFIRSNGYRDLRARAVKFKLGPRATNQFIRFTVRDDGAATTFLASFSGASMQFFSDSFFDQTGHSDASLNYDNNAPVWVRWRQSGDFYFWDTSADGVNWTNLSQSRLFRTATPFCYIKFEVTSAGSASLIYLDDFSVNNPTWDAIAGPGSVNFADASSPTTAATFTGAGVYTLRLTANDSEFDASGDVTVTVNPANHAPAVDAGVDQTVLFSEPARLTASVGDDALPAGSALSYSWSVVSGPGQATFSAPNSTRTDVSFSLPGYYVLRMTASDTQLTASDEVTVRVVASFDGVPGGVFVSGHDSDGHAGGEHDGQLIAAAERIIARAVEYVSWKKPNPKILLATDLRFPGGDNGDSRRALGRYNFTVADYGSGQEGALDLHTVNFKDYDILFVASSYGGWLRQDELDILNSRRADVMEFVNGGGGLVALAESGGRLRADSLYPGVTRDHYRFLPVPVSTVQFAEDEHGSRISPEGEAMGLTLFEYLNSTENYFTTTGGMDVIDYSAAGSITTLAYRGKRVNLDGSVNEAPVVYAGPDRIITMPNAAALAGVASDDALPEGSSVSVHWTVTKGPGSVTFENPDAAATSATFGAPGVYTLRLTGTDGQLSSYGETHITVNPTGQFVVVDAGADQTVRLPKTAALQASFIDGRVSRDVPLALRWEKVSGPGEVSFTTPNAPATTASFAAPGVYRIRFSAGDSAYTGSDELTVTVRPVLPFFGDDFDDNTNDPLKWYYGPGVTERDHQLQIDVPDSASLAEFISAGTMDMTDDGAYVRFELPDYADPSYRNGGRIIYWRMQASEGHWFQWIYRDGGMDFWLDGAFLLRDSYGQQFRYWRMIHYADHDRVNFDTSMDGQNWLTHYSLIRPYSFALDKLTFRLITGAQGGGAAGTVKIDNVNTTMPYAGPNHPPTPVTGGPYRATVGVPLQLDGSRSIEPDDFITEYAWDFGDGTTGSGPMPVHTYNSVGTYTVRLTVKDPDGSTGTTTTTVSVNLPNQTPVVNAGQDQTVRLPAAATLGGSVSDDGLPDGAALTAQWSVVSGPGAVAFANASSLNTTVTFAGQGTYVLRLTASDTELSASDDVTVTVEPAPPNQPPVVSAGEDQTVTPGLNLVRNGGGEEQIINGEIPGWTKAEGETWAQAPAGTSNFYDSFEGDTYLHAPGDEHAELRQDVDVSAYADSIKAGAQEFAFSVAVRAAAETPADGARVVFEFRDASNTNVLATVDSGEKNSSETWQLIEGAFTAPAGSAWVRVRLIAARNSGVTTDAYFDAVSLRAVTNAAVRLYGAVTDDGLPAGSTTAQWSVLSGPGAVMFADEHAASTTASFAAPGEYVLRLTASDTAATVADELTIHVTEANQAPTVNAGVDQTITLPTVSTALAGTIGDDGLPQGRSVSTRWRKIAGPGAVTFADASSASTDVTFSEAGNYVLRLTATDSEFTASDHIAVTVKPEPPNQAPHVNAGPDQAITMPADTVALNGEASDDGLPSGSTLTTLWEKVSGPGAVTFGDLNQTVTTARFAEPGVYVLRLTGSDGSLTESDDVKVIVNGMNKAPEVNAGVDQAVTLPNDAALSGTATDDGLPADSSLTVSWTMVSGPGTVTFTNPAAAATTATFSTDGTYVLRLTAIDSELTSTDEVTVTVNPEQPKPTVVITSPGDGSELTTRTPVVGTVSGGQWRLEYRPGGDALSPSGWTVISSGSAPVQNGPLGTFDPTTLLNGNYTVRLVATNAGGRSSFTWVSVTVEGEQKVGNFTISFNDLSVPVAGLPIQLTRTYDSRDKRVGDFGTGWTLGIANVRVEKNGVLGQNWEETRGDGFLPAYCVEPTRAHLVTVTFPGGKVYKFRPAVSPHCQPAFPIEFANVTFEPMPGTNGSLAAVGSNEVVVAGSSYPGPVDLHGDGAFGFYDPTVFRLMTEDGTTYVLEEGAGVRSVADTSGNTLTIGRDGIIHSSGKSVSFTRDAGGRITQITDPSGATMSYAYDALGDLVGFTDRENNLTTYTYNSSHGLLTIKDPRGVQPVRNEYDDSGRLIKNVDAFGKTVVYEHDADGRRETITDRLGRVTVVEYNQRGNVVKTTDPDGNVRASTYDAQGNRLSDTDPLGRTTTYTYDAQDNRTSITDPLGHTTRFTYDAHKLPLTVTDAMGRVTAHTYDAQGRLLTTKDALGNTTSSTYTALGLLETATDAVGSVTRFEYDATGRMTKETNPQGVVTSYTYDANGNRLTLTETRTAQAAAAAAAPRGAALSAYAEAAAFTSSASASGETVADSGTETLTTAMEYDKLDRLVKVTYPDGSTVRTEYDEAGRKSAEIDQLGRRAGYEYDDMGNLARVTYADGTKNEYTYDADGRRTKVVDRAGQTTSFTYDNASRVEKITYTDGKSVRAVYDALGRVTATFDALGNQTTYEYDPACGCSNRVTKVTDALSHATIFTYDDAGNRVSMTDAAGRTTRYEYDAFNRLIKALYPDGTFSSVTFDELGRRVSKTDQAGKTTKFEYDSLDRLVKVLDALNQPTKFGYDELGDLTSQTDANDHATTFEYDSMHRRVKRTLPMGMSETYAYDAAGRLTSRTDFKGKTTTYAYDVMSRLLSKTPDPSLGQPAVTYTYNQAGLRASMSDASGVTTYTYDTRYRMTGKQTPQGALTYTYDSAGNLLTTRSSNSNGLSVDYGYDALNRLSSVKDNRTGATRTVYQYDSVGNLGSTTYANGVVTTYDYDGLNRLTGVASAKGSTLASYAYTLGAAGNRLSVAELSGRKVNYTYDDLYRLTGETVSDDPGGINGAVSYTFDAVGNRKTQTSTLPGVADAVYDYDANDRLTSDTSDANGNTTASAGNTYGFDFENRLTEMNGGAVGVVYDGDGNRVSKTAGGVTVKYLVDENNHTGYAQVVEELVGGQVQRVYTYGHDLISQNQLIGGEWKQSFYGYDGHGSVRYLTDASGTVTDTYDYDAFGNILSRTGSTPNDYLYAGEQYDAHLGLQYLRARYINHSTGRFWTQDSYEGNAFDPISLHKYLYANADPANNIDPSGYFSLTDINISAGIHSTLSAMSGLAMRVIIWWVRKALYGAIAGAVGGAIYGGIDHALGDGEILAGVLDGAKGGVVMGAIFGPVAAFKAAIPVLTALGIGLGIEGAEQSLQNGYYAQAVFRVAAPLLPWAIGKLRQLIGPLRLGRSGSGVTLIGDPDGPGVPGGGGGNSGVSGGPGGAGGCPGGRCGGGSGTGSKGTCFVAGTLVQTLDGEKPIEEVTAGDSVLSTDPEAAGQPASTWQPVTRLYERSAPVVLDIHIGKTKITATPEHPFWVLGAGWTAAKELRRGSALLTKDGVVVHVDSVVRREGEFKVYNFEVADSHTYYVSPLGILVHNQCGQFPDTPEQMDDILGFPGNRLPDVNPQTGQPLPGRNRVDWDITTPNGKLRITYEQHPYHTNAPDFHRLPHWHVDWPGRPQGPHPRFSPGDQFPNW